MILFPEFHARYGPWAVVAGASEGIGQAYAHVLAERGFNVLLLARRLELLEREATLLRRRHRVEIRTASIDLAAPDLAARFEAAIEGLDIGLLIYNTCYSVIADFADTALDHHQRMLDVNCRGPVTLAKAVLPRLLARGRGGLILMSSMAGLQGSALVATYAATKSFNVVLAESLWSELKPKGIDVLACVAGATLTPGFESVTPEAKRAGAFPMRADAVAREGLHALGRRPTHIAGWLNRLVNAIARLMTRRLRTVFFSKATQGIYGSPEKSS